MNEVRARPSRWTSELKLIKVRQDPAIRWIGGTPSLSKERTINQLRRKLALLVEYGHYADLTAIAEAIGTKLKTMESWADTGTDKATPGLIPAKHYPGVIELFRKAIHQNHAIVDVEAVLRGTVADVEQWLRPLPPVSIMELIARDADFNAGKLFVEKSKPIGAVARRSEQTEASARTISTRDWFRIEFPSRLKSGHVIALQQCRRQWAFCPIHQDAASPVLLVPGLDQHRQTDWMQEREWLGLNRFYALELGIPWPADIKRGYDAGAPLSAELLQRITETYEAQPAKFRSVFGMEISVEMDKTS